jgi:hypothetical protein
LSLESLRIALGPDRVDAVRLRRGWRGVTAIERQSVACAAAAGAASWRPAIDTLSAVLPGAKARARGACVALADHFVRYLLVSWRTDLRDASEYEALARIRFREVYGAASDGWAIRLVPTRFGAPYVACAMDQDLLDELRAVFARHRLRLASVRPVFVASYNRWRRTHRAGDCWFAVYGSGRLSLCRVEGGAWRSVRTEKSSGELAMSLQLAVEREAMSLGVDPQGAALHVFAPGQPRLAAGSLGGMKVSVYEPLPGIEPRFAMALV